VHKAGLPLVQLVGSAVEALALAKQPAVEALALAKQPAVEALALAKQPAVEALASQANKVYYLKIQKFLIFNELNINIIT
jgi:tRNA U34 5-carboxymethylaminomethyl modifying enzyme MnmG/GidA